MISCESDWGDCLIDGVTVTVSQIRSWLRTGDFTKSQVFLIKVQADVYIFNINIKKSYTYCFQACQVGAKCEIRFVVNMFNTMLPQWGL